MKVTIEGTSEQICDGCLWVVSAIRPQYDIPPGYLMQRRARNIEIRRANKERRERMASDRKLIHSAFLLARKNNDPRMRDLLDALTGKTEVPSTIPMAQEILKSAVKSEE